MDHQFQHKVEYTDCFIIAEKKLDLYMGLLRRSRDPANFLIIGQSPHRSKKRYRCPVRRAIPSGLEQTQ